MESFVSSALSSAAVGGLLIAAAAWLMRAWIIERLSRAIKHEYDRDLEAYRTAIASTVAATAEGQKAAIEKRLDAFDRIWRAMLALRNNTGSITTFLDILTVKEYG